MKQSLKKLYLQNLQKLIDCKGLKFDGFIPHLGNLRLFCAAFIILTINNNY